MTWIYHHRFRSSESKPWPNSLSQRIRLQVDRFQNQITTKGKLALKLQLRQTAVQSDASSTNKLDRTPGLDHYWIERLCLSLGSLKAGDTLILQMSKSECIKCIGDVFGMYYCLLQTIMPCLEKTTAYWLGWKMVAFIFNLTGLSRSERCFLNR